MDDKMKKAENRRNNRRIRSEKTVEIKAPSSAVNMKELPATAICGNDISSSCLYVSALSIIYAGKFAWVVLLIVAGVLYLYRKIYGEVVGALPLNGGAYNALLNTTSKSIASLAAALTLLSYMATAVISASEAMHYANTLWQSLPVIEATIVLMALFMVLTIIGIGESSKVAVVIFITHLVSLTLLVCAVGIYVAQNGFGVLETNYQVPVRGGLITALFFGFSAAMLGISGFESSANFVEEQSPGVFPKTLRNMWLVISIFSPYNCTYRGCVNQPGSLTCPYGKHIRWYLAVMVDLNRCCDCSEWCGSHFFCWRRRPCTTDGIGPYLTTVFT